MVRKATDYYQVLGVKPEVSTLEIKRAYRELAKSHHPDIEYHGKTDRQRTLDHERMARLNEAYETLVDKRKRAEYDSTIGANGASRGIRGKHPTTSPHDDAEARDVFLRQVFHPSRHAITKILSKYKQQLADLSLDIYDEELVATFELYVDEIENTLRKAANALGSKHVPSSLYAAVAMMRYSIAQAVDGLEEARRFCQNYDYNHLHMAANLFKESNELSRKALQLTRA
jgi:molecular chaperone DnaJ